MPFDNFDTLGPDDKRAVEGYVRAMAHQLGLNMTPEQEGRRIEEVASNPDQLTAARDWYRNSHEFLVTEPVDADRPDRDTPPESAPVRSR